jgi:N6-L-threonylcarbamoyladenine synthase/tRNA threonylcarbamoyladenosine biosynthesis protein TsaB
MIILALESSTSAGSVALMDDSGKVLAQRATLIPNSHSEVLNQFVDDILKESALSLKDIDAFAVGLGPGSFTGIRVAANIGRTYCYAFNKPLITVDTLTNLAYQAGPGPKPVLALMNAHKNMVYFGLFEFESGLLSCKVGPSAYFVRELNQAVTEKFRLVGDAFKSYGEHFHRDFLELIDQNLTQIVYPTAEALAALAFKKIENHQTIDWKSFTPLYIRASEAEESKKGIKIQPLK